MLFNKSLFILTFYLFATVFLFTNCKNDSSSKKIQKEKLSFSDSIAASGKMAKVIPESEEELKTYYKQAKSIVAHRIKEKSKTWAILDVGVWEYEFIYKDGAMSKAGQYAGKWIDFDEKNNYQYGNFENVKGKGRYHYDNDSHLLLLVDEDQNVRPLEYEVKLVNDMMIFQGRNTYGSNAQQAKLIKINSIPVKK